MDSFECSSLYVERDVAPGKVIVRLRGHGEWLGWLARNLRGTDQGQRGLQKRHVDRPKNGCKP